MPIPLVDIPQPFRDLVPLLLKGASLPAAAKHLGLDPLELVAAIAVDPSVKAIFDAVDQLLSFNVQAALYQAAMKGRVPAQQAWLRNREAARNGAPPSLINGGYGAWLDSLSEEEMVALAREQGIACDDLLEGEGGCERGGEGE